MNVNQEKIADRTGYITTNSGRKFYPFNPKVEDVHHDDIIHSLCHKCRWNGHVNRIYTVGAHSIMVYHMVKRLGGSLDQQLQALMHDASEAYCVDMPSPLKKGFPDFIEMEDRISKVIAEKYKYHHKMYDLVALADRAALIVEAKELFTNPPSWLTVNQDGKSISREEELSLKYRCSNSGIKETMSEFYSIFKQLLFEISTS